MQKCMTCLHWYEDDHFMNDICTPTCNDCAEFVDIEEMEDDL